MKTIIKLINNERKGGAIVPQKAYVITTCDATSRDTCSAIDAAHCFNHSYDVCGKDYVACHDEQYDYCQYKDESVCSAYDNT